MDFDSMKAAASVNYTTQTASKKQSADSEKIDVNNVTSEKEVIKAKDIYSNILSEAKENNGESSKNESDAYTDKEIDTMIKIANDKLAPIKKSFEYSVHEITKRLTIKILDSDTKEVIKEIPPEKIQNALAKMWELSGLIVDEKR